MTSIRLKLKRNRREKSTRIKFDIEKLKDPDVAAEFQAQIGGKFGPLLAADLDVESFNNQLNDQLTSVAENVLGKARVKKQPWMTNEVLKTETGTVIDMPTQVRRPYC